jgi:hypothetical protein
MLASGCMSMATATAHWSSTVRTRLVDETECALFISLRPNLGTGAASCWTCPWAETMGRSMDTSTSSASRTVDSWHVILSHSSSIDVWQCEAFKVKMLEDPSEKPPLVRTHSRAKSEGWIETHSHHPQSDDHKIAMLSRSYKCYEY